MGRRRPWIGMTLAAATAPVVALLSAAAPAQAQNLGAHWVFTETGSPPSVLHDTSGNGNDGRPRGGIVGDGGGYTFDGTGRVEVPDSPTLNPGKADFSFSVTLSTKLPASGTDYDILRKGFASTGGGEFKVEILNVKGVAQAFCLVKDTNKHTARVRSTGASLADGRSHTITCAKTSTKVTVTVDARAPRSGTASGGLGNVANSAPLTIGAKADSGGDWLRGRMTDARVGFTGSAPAPTQPEPSGDVGAHWGFNETGQPPSVLADDSGNRNDGRPRGGIVGTGSAYSFNGKTGLVEVPDSPTLDPGTAGFTSTVRITTSLPASGAHYDVLRKGLGSTSGGQFGLQLVNANGVARPVCFVEDSAGHKATIRGSGDTLADGQAHTITCRKTSTGLTVTVDGGSSRTRTVSAGLGSVSNASSLVLGATRPSGGNWFAGSIADATLE